MLDMEKWPRLDIEEGHNSGACFWIQPVRLAKPNESDIDDDGHGNKIFLGIVEHRCQEISIDEFAVEMFLWSLLRKYYDEFLSVQYRDKDSGDFSPDFEWYLTHNVYTYETVRRLIKEIKERAINLRNMKGFHTFFAVGGTDEDKKKANELVADFYERLCSRLERMMNESPEFECISFMGP